MKSLIFSTFVVIILNCNSNVFAQNANCKYYKYKTGGDRNNVTEVFECLSTFCDHKKGTWNKIGISPLKSATFEEDLNLYCANNR